MENIIEIIEFFIRITEIILYINLPFFFGSTYYLIVKVKEVNMELIRDAVTNPIIPDLDLNFFSELRNEYRKNYKNNIIPIVNKISCYISFGSIFFFLMVIIQDILWLPRRISLSRRLRIFH